MSKFTKFFLLLFVALGALTSLSFAKDWYIYQSDSGLFSLRIPEGVEESSSVFRISPNAMAQVGKAVSTIDNRPYRGTQRHYIVRYEQGLGRKLENSDIGRMILEALDDFAAHYTQKMNGKVRKRQNLIYQGNAAGGEIMVSYEDSKLGEHYVRARIFFSEFGKVEQILVGEHASMNSFTTRQFVGSMVVQDGYKSEAGDIKDEWTKHVSPLGVFTAYLPEKQAPYVPEGVKTHHSGNAERVSIRFYDPIWKEIIFYNIYGYKFDQNLNYLRVENLLTKKHVLRHRFEKGKTEMKRSISEDKIPIVETKYIIDAPDGHPYVRQVDLRAFFSGNKMVVHEIMGSPSFVGSSFIKLVSKNVEFHPGAPAQSE